MKPHKWLYWGEVAAEIFDAETRRRIAIFPIASEKEAIALVDSHNQEIERAENKQ